MWDASMAEYAHAGTTESRNDEMALTNMAMKQQNFEIVNRRDGKLAKSDSRNGGLFKRPNGEMAKMRK